MADKNETKPPTAAPITVTAVEEGDNHLSSWRLTIVIGSLCLGIFLFGLDVNIIGVAIPPITTEFRSLPDVAWYGSAYLLTLTAFQPFFGNLYKFFNAKVVYLSSLVIFEAGSAICAAAQSSAVLIFGRAFLGLGAAGLLQGALAIIGYAVTVDRVPLFQSIVVSSLVISVTFGPVIGGALTEYVNWRTNVPAGAVVMIIVFFFVPVAKSANSANQSLPIREKLRRMDTPGLILFLGGITSLLLALTWGGQTYPWRDSRIIGLFVGFGLITILFCYWLVRQGDLALIPLRVLKKRSIYMGSITLTGFGTLNVVYGYYLPILFQSAQGVSTTESGLRYIALVGPQIVALIIVGSLVSKWGYYAGSLPAILVPYMIAGSIICSIGAGLLTTVNLSTSTPKWAAYLVLTGLGLGMGGQLPYTALQAVLDPEDVATGNAIAVFSFHLAGSVGTAIGQSLLIDGLYSAVPKYTQVVSASDVVQIGATGLALVATSPEVLHALRSAYVEAVRRTIILGLAGTLLAVPSSCAMEWVNIKRVAEERDRNRRLENGSTEISASNVSETKSSH
ncbi:major facilitator superfamily domain-containing protein [Durotheca rogersii]|uniref:major facilitator superfamily domain-containing protein n=1 Tax=Durotheca rogersii TaxID=419775 RepID=UPI00221FB3CD|nr:major facilitator superfamily domain-containing protein [Durotheca rogersii]KAI5861439.1 major facilitator superfamily domain-containing protein [Durotheca rogersii]